MPLWTVARQSPLSMGFSRQEYWSELPFPPPGNRPNPGIVPPAPALQEDFFFTAEPLGKPLRLVVLRIKKRIKTPNFYFFEFGKRIIFYLFRKTCLICTKQWQETEYVVLTGGENPAVKLVEDCVRMCPALDHLLNTHVGQFC